MNKKLGLLLLLLSSLMASAQVSNNTSLVGTVTDQSGGVVPGAKVTGTNVDTKVSYTGTTNEEGFYSIPFVAPGTYNVTVEATGFPKVTTNGVIVTMNLAVRTDAVVKLGATSSEVNVSASTPTLSTDDALLGETVDSEKVHDLPLNGRHAIDLAATNSNITISGAALTGNPPGNRASGSGTRSVNNSISLDGISIMNNLITTAFIAPNPDALDSVQTQNGNYTAQYGDYLGVHVNMITRAGTNGFHGTVYDYIQNDGFDAKSWLQAPGSPKAQLRYNDFGGVLSGPVIIPHLYNGKDKTFFLGSYEGVREHGGTFTLATVLSNRMRGGDFGELCLQGFQPNGVCTGYQPTLQANGAPTAAQVATYGKQIYQVNGNPYINNVVPVDTISARILPYMSAPTSAGVLNNWQGNLPTVINENSNLERVDHNIGDKVRLFARWAQQSVNNYTQAVNLANTAYTTSTGRNGAFGFTYILTPNMVNDLHLGFNIFNTQIVNQQYQTGQTSAGSALGIPGFTADVASGNPGLVDMLINNYQGIVQSGTNWFQGDRTLTFYDQLSYTRNKHTFMAGVSIRKFTLGRSAANLARGQFIFDQTLLADAGAAFIAGLPTTLNSPLFQVKGSVEQYRDGFFFQDTWQATQKLTLQYGLRYELPQVATSLNGVGRIMTPDLTALYPAIGGTTALNAQAYPGFAFSGTNHDLFSPRFGLSYRATDKTVIRAGGGIYYNANQLNAYTLSSTNYPYSASVTSSNTAGQPLTFTLDNPNVPAPAAWPGPPTNPYSNFTVNHYLPAARMYQWNVDVGQEVWRNGGFELQYLGSRTIHLDESYYPNQPGPSAAFAQANRPNPAIGQIREINNDANSRYNGLTAILRQRVVHGLSTQLSYTWSHALDEGDSSNDGGSAMWQGHLKLDYGNSSYDIRNRFVGTVTYALPTFGGRSFAIREALGGWQANAIVDLRSGTPMNFTLSTDYAHIGMVGGAQRPNFVHQMVSTCSRNTVTGAGGSTQNSCLDITAFSLPAVGTFGDLHRNAYYSPGAANTNFSLFKNFTIYENLKFQLRGEAFNLFNHPNPAPPNSIVDSTSFGYITAANTSFTSTGARVLQIAGKINF